MTSSSSKDSFAAWVRGRMQAKAKGLKSVRDRMAARTRKHDEAARAVILEARQST